ncbi:MAG: oligosaccharide flippase family protein [Planctomycetota bacterium]|jgi:O-antigen/teichoic acid export membrane protein|nr:oligosaccharide flippase family protein [Planctomycetota bacterium]
MTGTSGSAEGEGIPPTKRVVKNTLWMTAASFCGRMVSYGTFVLLARFFTQTEVGVWAVLLTAQLFAEIISNLGLDKILIRDASRDRREGERLLDAVMPVKLAAGAIVGLAAYLCVRLGYPEIAGAYPAALAISFAAIPLIAVTRSLEAWHAAREQLRIPAIAQVLDRVVLVCVLAGVWLTRRDFGYFIGLSVLAPMARFLADYIPVRRMVRLAIAGRGWPLLSESVILFTVEIMAGIYLRIDLIFVSKLDSLAAAGLYNAAYRVFEFSTIIFSGYLLAIFPGLARKARLGLFESTFLPGLGVVAFAAILGILFRNAVMGLFGPAYLAASPAFAWLMTALPLSYVTSFMTNSLIAMGKTRFLLVMAVIVVGGNTLFNWLLIPRFSIAGAGMAFVLSEVVSIAVLLYFSGFLGYGKSDETAVENA